MIYWFTGQPAHGKTTLAKMLIDYLVEKKGKDNVFHIDGDDIRELFANKDYSILGRVNNVSTAQRIALYLHRQHKQVVVSIVSPYIDQREEYKNLLGDDIVEVYVHAERQTERDINRSIAYIKPNNRYIDIDTTSSTIQQSFKSLIDKIQIK